jgi:hypothetical protein
MVVLEGGCGLVEHPNSSVGLQIVFNLPVSKLFSQLAKQELGKKEQKHATY